MPSIFEDLENLRISIKGAGNISRLRAEDDPEKREALQDKFLEEREQEEGQRSLFQGIDDSVKSRNVDEGFDVRDSLDPNKATERRMREAGLEGEEPLAQRKREQQENVASVRDIVARNKAGEPISEEEKMLVFQVITDAVKGLSQRREQTLAQQQEQLNQVVDQTVGPQSPPA